MKRLTILTFLPVFFLLGCPLADNETFFGPDKEDIEKKKEGVVIVQGVEVSTSDTYIFTSSPDNTLDISTLGLKFTPVNAEDKSINYIIPVESEEIVFVDSATGLLTGKSHGKVEVKIASTDGQFSDTFILDVWDHVDKVSLALLSSATDAPLQPDNDGKYYFYDGNSIKLQSSVVPTTAYPNIAWSKNDSTNVAILAPDNADWSLAVTIGEPQATGSDVVITATAVDQGKSPQPTSQSFKVYPHVYINIDKEEVVRYSGSAGGDRFDLTVTPYYENSGETPDLSIPNNKTIDWTKSGDDIVDIAPTTTPTDTTANITVKDGVFGDATVTATLSYSGTTGTQAEQPVPFSSSDSSIITIWRHIEDVVIDDGNNLSSDLHLHTGDSYDLTASSVPDKGMNPELQWTWNNDNMIVKVENPSNSKEISTAKVIVEGGYSANPITITATASYDWQEGTRIETVSQQNTIKVYAYDPVDVLDFTPTDIQIHTGDTFRLSVEPGSMQYYAAGEVWNWSASDGISLDKIDEKIREVTINSSESPATITVKLQYGMNSIIRTKEKTYQFNTYDRINTVSVAGEGIGTINKYIGDASFDLTATAAGNPGNAMGTLAWTWSSDAEGKASVSGDGAAGNMSTGTVSLTSAGAAVITAEAAQGSGNDEHKLSDTRRVEIHNPPTLAVALDQGENKLIHSGESFILASGRSGQHADDATSVKWSVAGPATVNPTAGDTTTVGITGAGNVTVTATLTYGNNGQPAISDSYPAFDTYDQIDTVSVAGEGIGTINKYIGDALFDLTATAAGNPGNAMGTLTWTWSSDAVGQASVSGDSAAGNISTGTVSLTSAGAAVITAEAAQGSGNDEHKLSDTRRVEIHNPPTLAVALDQGENKLIHSGESFILASGRSGQHADDATSVKWSVAGPATVNPTAGDTTTVGITGAGNVTVTATLTYGNNGQPAISDSYPAFDTYDQIDTVSVAGEGIGTINKYIGDALFDLTATAAGNPGNAMGTLTWTWSSDAVGQASVSGDSAAGNISTGTVSLTSAGAAVITAEAAQGSGNDEHKLSDTRRVEIHNPPTLAVALDQGENKLIHSGESFILASGRSGQHADDATSVKWSVAGPATVNPTAGDTTTVGITGAGNVTVTATLTYGNNGQPAISDSYPAFDTYDQIDTVSVAGEGIGTINKYIGDALFDLTATAAGNPGNAMGTLTWTWSSDAVGQASVSGDSAAGNISTGTVSLTSAGAAVITAEAAQGSGNDEHKLSDTRRVEIHNPPTLAVALDQGENKLIHSGESFILASGRSGQHADDATSVKWSVAGPATVNPTAGDTTTVGITGAGNVTVTATLTYGNNGQPAISDSYPAFDTYDQIDTVSVAGEGIGTINKYIGDALFDLTATAAGNPGNAMGTLTWTWSSDAVGQASVSGDGAAGNMSTGTVSLTSAGAAVITAEAAQGSGNDEHKLSDTRRVEIHNPPTLAVALDQGENKLIHSGESFILASGRSGQHADDATSVKWSVAGPATVNPTAGDTTTVGITGAGNVTVTATLTYGNNGQPAISDSYPAFDTYDQIDTVSVTGEGIGTISKYIGDTFDLTATAAGNQGNAMGTLTWTWSSDAVGQASVSGDGAAGNMSTGTVSLTSAGAAVITAEAAQGSGNDEHKLSDTRRVEIHNPPTLAVALDQGENKLTHSGESFILASGRSGQHADDATSVKWSVAGPATVNPTAGDTTTVGITGAGNVTVTATLTYGNNGQPAISDSYPAFDTYDQIDTVSVTGEGIGTISKYIGDTFDLTATAAGNQGNAMGTLTWTWSSDAVGQASVSGDGAAGNMSTGTVSLTSAGAAVITAEAAQGSGNDEHKLSDTRRVEIHNPPTLAVALDQGENKLTHSGESFILASGRSGQHADDATSVKWSVAGPATVNPTAGDTTTVGITGAGNVTVTATLTYGNNGQPAISDSYPAFDTYDQIDTVSVTGEGIGTISKYIGDTFDLTATAAGNQGNAMGTLTWTWSSDAVGQASVSGDGAAGNMSTGTVSLTSAGAAVITAEAAQGSGNDEHKATGSRMLQAYEPPSVTIADQVINLSSSTILDITANPLTGSNYRSITSYSWQVVNTDSTGLTIKSGEDTQTATFEATGAGTANLRVTVTDDGGRVITDDFDIVVNP